MMMCLPLTFIGAISSATADSYKRFEFVPLQHCSRQEHIMNMKRNKNLCKPKAAAPAGPRERSVTRGADENIVLPSPNSVAAAKKSSDSRCACDSCVKRITGLVAAKWEDSDAKQHIRQCLEDDEMHAYWTMKPGLLYDSNKHLFHQYKYENFRTNLNALKKSIALNVQQIKFDENALKVESNAFSRMELTSHGNPFYDTSTAKESLMKDVKDGAADAYKNHPRDLWAKRPEYQSFQPNVFTKHFNREIRRSKEEVGWQHRRNLRGSKLNHQKCSERAAEESDKQDSQQGDFEG